MKQQNILEIAIVAAFCVAAYLLYSNVRLLRRSQYYDDSVFDSPDEPGSGKRMHADTLRKLDKATELYAERFHITSGVRTEIRNTQIGGASRSSHLVGRAVDIATTPMNQDAIIDSLTQAGFQRIGIYQRHVHADDDPTKNSAIWHG